MDIFPAMDLSVSSATITFYHSNLGSIFWTIFLLAFSPNVRTILICVCPKFFPLKFLPFASSHTCYVHHLCSLVISQHLFRKSSCTDLNIFLIWAASDYGSPPYGTIFLIMQSHIYFFVFLVGLVVHIMLCSVLVAFLPILILLFTSSSIGPSHVGVDPKYLGQASGYWRDHRWRIDIKVSYDINWDSTVSDD